MRVVFIHGRAQEGKDPVELRALWERKFDEGLNAAGLARPSGLSIEFPFYGDHLDNLINELDASDVEGVVKRGADNAGMQAEFVEEFLMEIAQGANVTEADIRKNFDQPISERGPLNWKWVQAILKTLDKSEKIGAFALDKFTQDVYVYLTNKAVRKEIDGIVSRTIGEEPCVVVGHSLGSVIGYNVLRDQDHPTSRYVTLGSPLGLKSIKRRLKSPLTMPDKTTDWYNARDPNDGVALRLLDSTHFGISPAIVNHNAVDNQTDNQHGIIGYLPDPWVARAIHDGLR